ncbi:hypothetical protein J4E06_06940 [Muricauda sp. NFXS6]|uniref:DUF6624 domain-containing protein n=1 Tax=Allomuricauda sp. NFXS6 TaxID=2819094 RepID=UPI0032DF390F
MTSTTAAKRIMELQDRDLDLRQKLLENGTLSSGYNEAMEALHNDNARELETIMEAIGYPSVPKVGKEANQAAWLIVQHAIGLPSFMKKFLHHLQREAEKDKDLSIQLAYLTDRVRMMEGQEQWYGTQFDWDQEGLMSPAPYDNLDKVNARRRDLGLNSLEEQTEAMRLRVRSEGQRAPKDMEGHRREQKAWRAKVGWI